MPKYECDNPNHISFFWAVWAVVWTMVAAIIVHGGMTYFFSTPLRWKDKANGIVLDTSTKELFKVEMIVEEKKITTYEKKQ